MSDNEYFCGRCQQHHSGACPLALPPENPPADQREAFARGWWACYRYCQNGGVRSDVVDLMAIPYAFSLQLKQALEEDQIAIPQWAKDLDAAIERGRVE